METCSLTVTREIPCFCCMSSLDHLLPTLVDFLQLVGDSGEQAEEILHRFDSEEALFVWLNEKYGTQFDSQSRTWRGKEKGRDQDEVREASDEEVHDEAKDDDSEDDDSEYSPSSPSSQSSPSLTSSPSSPLKKKLRQNPTSGTGSAGSGDDEKRPVCMYGTACYRKNPIHFEEFAHPWRRD